MKMLRKQEGFTLVELMVVVLIIGILIAVAIPVFNAASANAETKTCQANERTLSGAVQQYVAAAPGNVEADATQANLVPGYLRAWPVCPKAAANAYTMTGGMYDCADVAH